MEGYEGKQASSVKTSHFERLFVNIIAGDTLAWYKSVGFSAKPNKYFDTPKTTPNSLSETYAPILHNW